MREMENAEHSGLIGRLDRETSGGLVMTKSKDATRMAEAAKQLELSGKVYVALVRGEVPLAEGQTGLVCNTIGRSTSSPVRPTGSIACRLQEYSDEMPSLSISRYTGSCCMWRRRSFSSL
jgi:23S rRNA-/tRNA-specific pseudouridylate synthase